MDARAASGQGIVKHVVPGGGYGEDMIVTIDAKLLDVDVRVFPNLLD